MRTKNDAVLSPRALGGYLYYNALVDVGFMEAMASYVEECREVF